MKKLVVGIGQSMRGDDAAGLEVVRLWREHFPESAAQAQVELSELPGLGLLEMLEGTDTAVLVDAVQASNPPGSILRLGPDELAGFLPETGSAHGWGVAETLQMGRSLYSWLEKRRIILIGIVGKDFDLGKELSPEVRRALTQAVELVEQEFQDLTGD
jgi:hydrogenase maturation protease